MEKRLYKSRNKMIFGVCAGVAEYFKMDPTMMRIIFAAAFFLFGSGLLLYIVMAIVMPNPPVAP